MLATDNPNAVSIYILVNLGMINYFGGASEFNDRIRVGVPQTFCKEANKSWLYLTNYTRRPTGDTHREPWCNSTVSVTRLHIILDHVAGPCCGEHHLAKNTRPTDCVVAALSWDVGLILLVIFLSIDRDESIITSTSSQEWFVWMKRKAIYTAYSLTHKRWLVANNRQLLSFKTKHFNHLLGWATSNNWGMPMNR